MLYYNQSAEEVLERFKVSGESGLSLTEVKKQQKRYGSNSITTKGRPLWQKLIEPFVDIFMLVLVLAAVISFVQGHMLDGWLVIAIVVINAVINYVQQFSTDKILRSLRKKIPQKVRVLRSKHYTEVEADELVPGDIIFISEGDKVPVDGRIISLSSALINEATLTGESAPVKKATARLSGNRAVFEQTNMVFSGSFVVSGELKVLTVRTGNDTEYGRIATLASDTVRLSPIQQKVKKLVSRIAVVIVGMAAVAFALSMMRGVGLLDSLQFVLAMTVSAVPEGLPIAISITLAIGMRRMARKKALVTNMHSIETIGAITVICTDKTGTLTENRLTVKDTRGLVKQEILNRAIALSVINPEKSHDELDKAMQNFAKLRGVSLLETEPLKELPFNQSLAMSGNLWNHGNKFLLSVKGAPEMIIEASSLDKKDREKMLEELDELAADGYRVVAVAEAVLDERINSLSKLDKNTRFNFLGLVAVADTLRTESRAAIKEAHRAGISVRMITGDLAETAFQIGKELGLAREHDQVLDCTQIDNMDEKTLEEKVRNTVVFARVTPEAKFKILSILKKKEVTAMTGDGVNDVPALVNAHVGIAMGSGSHIARDAGDIILLDDNFTNIITAIREGRIIISNIKRMMFYLLATNAGEAITMIGALILGTELPITPIQILWINLVTDSLLVIPLGMEGAESNLMREGPEPPEAPIISRLRVIRIVIVSMTMAGVALGVYSFFNAKYGHAVAGSLTFVALVVSQWANAFSARSHYQSVITRLKSMNAVFYVGLVAAVILQAIVLFTPFGKFLHVVDVPLADLGAVALIAFIIPLMTVEIHKMTVNHIAKYKR